MNHASRSSKYLVSSRGSLGLKVGASSWRRLGIGVAISTGDWGRLGDDGRCREDGGEGDGDGANNDARDGLALGSASGESTGDAKGVWFVSSTSYTSKLLGDGGGGDPG